jgi:GT2 family glycosyltransferase
MHMPAQNSFKDLTVIIPLSPIENQQSVLLADLKALSDWGMEVIQCSKGSRACSLNKGAAQARGQWLWFVHADSRISERQLRALQRSLEQQPDAVHYFDLAFQAAPRYRRLVCINAWGANLRSKLFKAPFGDQAFCMHRDIFRRLGGFNENVSYGEDLLLVRRARRNKVPLIPVHSPILTSPRKYIANGWLRLTLLYQWRWISLSVKDALAHCRWRRIVNGGHKHL